MSLLTTITTFTNHPTTHFWGTLICSSCSPSSTTTILSLRSCAHSRPICALKTDSSQDSYNPDLLRRKPVISDVHDDTEKQLAGFDNDSSGSGSGSGSGGGEERWVDWEDQILEDTVPLVGFVRMILHSGKYQSGDRLVPEHESTILERLLPYHPECDKKIGCGVDYITIGYHPQFEESRCMFIVRKDGELVDFSYWKCIKGFIRKNYPLYADSFILKHFRRRRRYE